MHYCYYLLYIYIYIIIFYHVAVSIVFSISPCPCIRRTDPSLRSTLEQNFTSRRRSLSRELAEDILLKKLIVSPFLSRSVPVLLSLLKFHWWIIHCASRQELESCYYLSTARARCKRLHHISSLSNKPITNFFSFSISSAYRILFVREILNEPLQYVWESASRVVEHLHSKNHHHVFPCRDVSTMNPWPPSSPQCCHSEELNVVSSAFQNDPTSLLNLTLKRYESKHQGLKKFERTLLLQNKLIVINK